MKGLGGFESAQGNVHVLVSLKLESPEMGKTSHENHLEHREGEPEVILLDRPCSALDPVSTAKIEESLKQLKDQFTIIITPHNVQQAGRIADRVAFMLMGSLIEHGLTHDVFKNPKDKRTNDYITGRFG